MKHACLETSCRTLLRQLPLLAGAPARSVPGGIVGCGVDVVGLAGLERSIRLAGQAFLDRIYTEPELGQCEDGAAALGEVFAAKEAVSKALGTGMRGVGWREIEILRETRLPLSQLGVSLTGGAGAVAAEQNIAAWSLSAAHDAEFALAFAVAWRHGAVVLNPSEEAMKR